MVNVNDYKSRVKIYVKKTYATNDFGGYSTSWTLVDTVWGKLDPLSGRELIQYKQNFPTAQYAVRIRYRAKMNTNMRLRYRSRNLDIHYIEDIGNRHEELKIICEDVNDEQ